MIKHDIVLNSITKIFRVGFLKDRLAVDNISLEVPRGQIVGLLGPNGSGKSTTLKMILGFLKPTSGEILVCGHPASDRLARSFIGYLPENPRFQRFLTGRDLLLYYASLLGLKKNEAERRADYLLNLVGLPQAGNERVQGYSKGMTQRLAIAQSLLNHPKLIILDEPMSGLDPLGRMEIRRLIGDIHQEMPDSTIFFSSHVLEDVEQLCSFVALLQKGKLKAYCKMEELLQQERQRYEITLKDISTELAQKIFPQHESRRTAMGITFTTDSTESLASDLASLIKEKISILTITTQRRRLEEALFLDKPIHSESLIPKENA